jgi:hypothetical protein
MGVTAGGIRSRSNVVDLYNIASGSNAFSITTSMIASTTAAPSTSAPSLEHPKVVLTLTGSISTFGEGSARRAAFVSGLAAVLRITENQIVIVSVTEGSVIVELGFVRLGGVHPSPADVVLRLKSAAASGELEQFGVTELSVGQEVVFTTSSETGVDVGVAVGASVGGVMCVVLLVAAVWRLRKYLSQVHSCSTLVRGFVPCS